MSAGGNPKFSKSEDAKKAGWFSRRHQTSDAHDEAKAKKCAKAEEQGLVVVWTKNVGKR